MFTQLSQSPRLYFPILGSEVGWPRRIQCASQDHRRLDSPKGQICGFVMIRSIDRRHSETNKIWNRFAVGAVQDLDLINEVFSYILTKARDQDVKALFWGLSYNAVARRPLAKFFKDNYDAVSTLALSLRYLLHICIQFNERFSTSYVLKFLVDVGSCLGSTFPNFRRLTSAIQASFCNLSTQKDYDDTESFFKASLVDGHIILLNLVCIIRIRTRAGIAWLLLRLWKRFKVESLISRCANGVLLKHVDDPQHY